MARLVTVPLLFAIACLMAGVYGALHNQISYTVSPEYFTQFKFHQFRIVGHYPNRIGAAVVGWCAAWWMGVVIGSFLIPAGMALPGTSAFYWGTVRAFCVVVVTTLSVGLLALLVAFLTVNPQNAGDFIPYGNEIDDDVAFLRAGIMHDFSYLGGLIGIVTGGITILRLRSKAATPASSSPAAQDKTSTAIAEQRAN